NWIGGEQIPFLEQRQLLIVNADDDMVLGVSRRSARSEKNCECGRESVPRDDVDLARFFFTHAQIGRILPQLRWLRQRFLPKKCCARERSLPQRAGYKPVRNVFYGRAPVRDKGNPFQP